MKRPTGWDRRVFLAMIVAGLLLKVAVAALFPLIGDELLYVGVWGRHPALGYYEHPPMTGWIAALLLTVSNAPAWVRLPTILVGPAIAWGIASLLRGLPGRLAATAFYLVPVTLFVIVLATDTPLIGWSFLCLYCLWRSEENPKRPFWAIAAGTAWGLAFLSKYFALLLLPPAALYLFFFAQRPTALRRAAFFVAGAAPAVLLHLGWNATHCWSNVVYNLVNRNAEEVGGWFQVRKFLEHQLYLLTPAVPAVLLWRWKAVAKLARARGRTAESRQFWLFGLAFAVPFAVFAVLSARVGLGLHYYLAFLPFLFVVLGLVLDRPQWKALISTFAVWSLAHGVLLGWALSQPLSHWKGQPFYRGLVMHSRMTQVVEEFKPYLETHVLASDSYTSAAALAYATGKNVAVFGGGISMAREDDRLTDYSQLEGESFAFFWPNETDGTHLRFFKNSRRKPFQVEGLTFQLVLADGFDYERYRREVLTWTKRMFYPIPPGLPQWGCPFTEHYFTD